MNIIYKIIIIIVIIQLLVTNYLTNTKEFSYRALTRNLSIVFGIFLSIKTTNYLYLLLPFILELMIEYNKLNGFYIEKYIATKYQYNDFWREINKKDSIFSNFTEANYDSILGFDTKDHSSANIKKILDWSIKIYNESVNSDLVHHNPRMLVDYNGNGHDGLELKIKTDNNKFKLISNICGIKSGMKILEVGFGEGDFLNYLKKEFNINATGVSISMEQVELVKQRGFSAYLLDMWAMTPEELGTYDLILQCGNLEYLRCIGEPYEIYDEYCKIIKKLLNPNGKYFITCIHLNSEFGDWSFYDKIKCYILWAGNDGSYPNGKDGFSKYAINSGFKIINQQDRTNDYFITSIIFMSYLQCMKHNCVNTINSKDLISASIKTIAAPYFLHTYLGYTPTKSFDNVPWLWQFTPQYKNTKWITPTTLEYILFQI